MAELMTYRLMRPGEEQIVSDLVARVFNEFVAADYSMDGIQEVLNYGRPERLAQRSHAGHFVLLALAGADVVGVIEMRNCEHVSLLFVDRQCQRRGIARQLLLRSLEICRSRGLQPAVISVHSSPYAYQIYRKLGFEPTAPEQTQNGIRYVPMKLTLQSTTLPGKEIQEKRNGGISA